MLIVALVSASEYLYPSESYVILLAVKYYQKKKRRNQYLEKFSSATGESNNGMHVQVCVESCP